MSIHAHFRWATLVAVSLWAASAGAADLDNVLDREGKPDLKAAGPLAFGPEGILFVADPEQAAIFAFDTAEGSDPSSRAPLNVAKIDQKIAALLGTSTEEILVNDLAANPATGTVYLSVSRGRGPDASPVIIRLAQTGKLAEFSLDDVKYSRAELPNPPSPDAKDRRGQSQRQESITDLAYVDGRVFVAGLSNEEFASKLRWLPFPFDAADEGTSVEIFHGSHGAFETRSPVRTFVPYTIGGEPYLLAAYTCTPLVKFPVAELNPGEKLRGTTVAELGNRNRPLDMIVYRKDGADYLLMANNSRGVMKISTENIDSATPITEPVSDKAGLPYETVAGLEGVQQLDRLDEENALVLVRTESGALDLKTVGLP